MPVKTLLIDIDEEGKVTITVEGIAGKGCHGLAKEFAEAMGGKIVEVGHTDDYFKTAVTQTVRTKQS